MDPNRDNDGSRFGGTIGLFGGMGGGAPLPPGGGTITGGTAIGTGWGDGAWSSEWPAAAAAAKAEYLPPGARWIVAVGCIFAGDGDEGAAICAFCAIDAEVIGARIIPGVGVQEVGSFTAADDGTDIVAPATIWGKDVRLKEAEVIPDRKFTAGVRERAMPVVGPDTGTLETVAVGCTILAILTMGVVHPSSEIFQ